jgi:hypothetical protein
MRGWWTAIGFPANGGRLPAVARGRPSPGLLLTLGVVFGGLAVASWVMGQSVLLSVAWTLSAVSYSVASWHARRSATDPLPPGRGRTSRWSGGRPDERWR